MKIKKERGIKILRCGAKRLLAAYAGKEQKAPLLCSLSAQADTWRLRSTAPQFIAASFRAAFFPSLLLFEEASA